MSPRRCRSLVLPLLAAGLVCAFSARADLTLSGRSTLTSLNMPNQGSETLYVKNHRMRRDLTDRGRSYSYLYDLKKREVAVVDHYLRKIDIHVLSRDGVGKSKDVRLDLEPTGRRHTLQGWNCDEHSLDSSLPAELGQEKVKVILVGQVWLERKLSERKAIAPFIKAVEADDFFVGAALPGKPGNSQAQGINEVMRKVLAKGMLCAAEIQLKYEGNGPMADLGRRMATRASIVYDSVSKTPLKDELFDLPSGYLEVRR